MYKTIYLKRVTTLCLFLTMAMAAHAQEENLDTIFDIHHMLAYLVAALMMSIFVMLFYNRVFFYRERDVNNQSRRLNAQLSTVLDANDTLTWSYNFSSELFSMFTAEDMKETKYTSFDFSQYYEREDFRKLIKTLNGLRDKSAHSVTITVRGNHPKEKDGKQRTYDISLSILRRKKNGQAISALGIQHDVTEEKERVEKARRLKLRYQTVFNSSQVDMIFYDAEGHLTEVNDTACETFAISDRDALIKRKVHITDIPSYQGIDLKNFDSTFLSSLTDIDKVKAENEKVPEIKAKGQMYYEADVRAIHGKDGKLQGVIAAGRNITDMVESNHHQRDAARLLNQSTRDIQTYINNINFSLKVSEVRLINYFPSTHELEIFSDLNKVQYRLSSLRAITMLKTEECHRARSLFRRMDHKRNETLNSTFCTILRDAKGRNVYLNFHLMPIIGKDGEITHYFGMCRNDTEMVYTEQQLQEEMAKAQETEQLKSTFLLNMSYELRTPLNAVVGFAGLYNEEHNPEDEPVFAEEIKNNTNVLLNLINDILYISRLDAHMIEFDVQPNDFATLFDGWCYMGWSTLPPDVKTSVENPYNRLEVKIDQQNFGILLQRLCTYTTYGLEKGMVRAKYDYRHGELMITVEDSGPGLSPEEQARAFDRFVHGENEHYGTGLDLPIVKELTEQMNGTIELQSDQGKGTSFFVSIPWDLVSMERKTEVIQ